MTSKHTPGPWTVEQGSHGGSFGGYWQINAEHDAVACNQFCMAGANQPDVSLANARLIAAAPDLLEAATDLLRSYGGDTPEDRAAEFNALAAAIAKAEGL